MKVDFHFINTYCHKIECTTISHLIIIISNFSFFLNNFICKNLFNRSNVLFLTFFLILIDYRITGIDYISQPLNNPNILLFCKNNFVYTIRTVLYSTLCKFIKFSEHSSNVS